MLRLGLFSGLVVLVVAMLVLAQRSAPGIDYENDPARNLERLEHLPEEDVAASKIHHALTRDRFEVGLFGNSRAVMVSHRDIGLPESDFFNFAVPGSSILQSTILIEELATFGKAPRVALVSLDHRVTEFFNNPLYPYAPRRWGYAIDDVAFGLTSELVGARELARMTWRHVYVEWGQLIGTFSARRLSARWREGTESSRARYRRDGSRRDSALLEPSDLEPIAERPRSILPGYLRRTISRLGRMRESGTTVVVYESPLAPGVETPANPYLDDLWNALSDACAAHSVVCLPSPRLGASDSPPYWPDAQHAPASLLGAWLAAQLELLRVRDG